MSTISRLICALQNWLLLAWVGFDQGVPSGLVASAVYHFEDAAAVLADAWLALSDHVSGLVLVGVGAM